MEATRSLRDLRRDARERAPRAGRARNGGGEPGRTGEPRAGQDPERRRERAGQGPRSLPGQPPGPARLGGLRAGEPPRPRARVGDSVRRRRARPRPRGRVAPGQGRPVVRPTRGATDRGLGRYDRDPGPGAGQGWVAQDWLDRVNRDPSLQAHPFKTRVSLVVPSAGAGKVELVQLRLFKDGEAAPREEVRMVPGGSPLDSPSTSGSAS